MIKEIFVFDKGSYDIDMHQVGTTSQMTLSQDNHVLSKVNVLSCIVDFDVCIDALLYNIGINEIWEYC